MELQSNIICCPVCGHEYLPAEIFTPKNFFGNPGQVVRNESGKIEFFTGSSMDTEDSYICDECGNEFTVKATLSFEVSARAKAEFDEEYVTTFEVPERLTLEEESLF